MTADAEIKTVYATLAMYVPKITISLADPPTLSQSFLSSVALIAILTPTAAAPMVELTNVDAIAQGIEKPKKAIAT